MKMLSSALGLVALCLFLPRATAADTLRPVSEGYFRDWKKHTPNTLPDGEAGSDAIFRAQIKDEASLRPRAGDKVKVRGKELIWRNITASAHYFDFNAILKSLNDHAAGYMVTYIECETERPGVILAVASNDEGRIYFNGVDIYAFSEPRPLMLDADKGKVTLKKGVNVIVFKVINEQNSWQAAVRLLDQSGAPLKDVAIRLSP